MSAPSAAVSLLYLGPRASRPRFPHPRPQAGEDRVRAGRPRSRVGEALPRPISPVARIAKAWDDKSVVVKAFVNRRSPDMHVGMNAAQTFERGRDGDEADIPDVAGAALLEPI